MVTMSLSRTVSKIKRYWPKIANLLESLTPCPSGFPLKLCNGAWVQETSNDGANWLRKSVMMSSAVSIQHRNVTYGQTDTVGRRLVPHLCIASHLSCTADFEYLQPSFSLTLKYNNTTLVILHS